MEMEERQEREREIKTEERQTLIVTAQNHAGKEGGREGREG